MKYTKFGEFFRILRLKHNEVLGDATEFFHVSASYISAVELGKRPVPKEWYDLISKHYNLTEEEKCELKQAMDESVNNIKIDLTDTFSKKRELAIAFQRSFDNVDDDLAQKILKMLKELNN